MRTQTTFSQDATFFFTLKEISSENEKEKSNKRNKRREKKEEKKGDKKSNRTTEANKLSKLINVREQSYL